jgi:hypothetical protein
MLQPNFELKKSLLIVHDILAPNLTNSICCVKRLIWSYLICIAAFSCKGQMFLVE